MKGMEDCCFRPASMHCEEGGSYAMIVDTVGLWLLFIEENPILCVGQDQTPMFLDFLMYV